MTTCNKAQANTSRPEEARLRLPDPGHNLPRDGEPLASPFIASPSCLPSSCPLVGLAFLLFHALLFSFPLLSYFALSPLLREKAATLLSNLRSLNA